MNEFSIINGIEFSAELIPTKSIAISFGGIKGKKFQNSKIQTREKHKESKILESSYISYDMISINRLSKELYQNQKIIVSLSPNIQNNFNDLSKTSRFAPNYEIGIEMDIFSSNLTNHQEGWFHRYLIEFMNSIKGVEYRSIDRHPYLKIRKDHYNLSNIENLFNQIGNNIIKQFLSSFPEIEMIQMTFNLGLEQVKAKREQIEAILQEQRIKFLHTNMVINDEKDYYTFDFDQTLAPFSSIILTPSTNDPAGFLCYTDCQEYFSSSNRVLKNNITQLTQKAIIDKALGEYEGLNDYFYNLSYQQIQKIQLYSTQYPLPISPFSEILFFKIPELSGYGLMSYDYSKMLLEKYTYNDLISNYADGHQHANILGFNRFDLEGERFKKISHQYTEIVWINASLMDKIRHFLPKSLLEQIATEKRCENEEEILAFLYQSKHPLYADGNRKSLDSKEIVAKSDNQLDSLLMDLEKSVSQPVLMKNLKLTLLSPTGEAFDVELKNVHLRADEILVHKKKI